jgi:hypothetical protein
MRARTDQRTLVILADPKIRDRAEAAARELQEAAREHTRVIGAFEEPPGGSSVRH